MSYEPIAKASIDAAQERLLDGLLRIYNGVTDGEFCEFCVSLGEIADIVEPLLREHGRLPEGDGA